MNTDINTFLESISEVETETKMDILSFEGLDGEVLHDVVYKNVNPASDEGRETLERFCGEYNIHHAHKPNNLEASIDHADAAGYSFILVTM